MNDSRESSPTTPAPDVGIAETIAQGCSERGGWNKPQLALIGVVWPPIKGWRTYLEQSGLRVQGEVHAQFIALRGMTARRPKHGQLPTDGTLTIPSNAPYNPRKDQTPRTPGTPRPSGSDGPQQAVVHSLGDR